MKQQVWRWLVGLLGSVFLMVAAAQTSGEYMDWVHFRGHEVRFKIRTGERHAKTNQNLHTRI
jgi:hypothetical protein